MPEFFKQKKDKDSVLNTNKNEILNKLIDDYTTIKQPVLMKMRREVMTKEEFMQDVENHLQKYYPVPEEDAGSILESFDRYVFGYSILTPLIENPEISDIRCVSYNNIRIKKEGERMSTDIKFSSPVEYKRFVEFVATKNQVNISNLHAIQKFVDRTSNPDYILRFSLVMPLLNTYEEPYLTIRKTPRDFPELADLVKKGMLSEKLAEELKERFRKGSTLIAGGNSAGKTTILNALKETLPENLAVMVTQQADELTSKRHPDMMFTHSLQGGGESDIRYDLKELAIAGLTMDIDYAIIGEVKGDEAAQLLYAAYSGQYCAATVHAPSAYKAVDKIIDYSLAAGSKYSKLELLKMMQCFKTIIYMENYKVAQVCEIVGLDEEKKELIYRTIYERGK